MVERTILVWVQHLLGIGHYARAAAIAGGLAARGWRVHLASGGTPIGLAPAGVTLHPLPPVRAADRDFSALLDADGRPIDDAWRRRRRDALLALARAAAPDALLIEHWPFGRRQFDFELMPLMDATPAPAFVSLRDVLVSRRTKREAEAVDLVRRRFARVLVHGDPGLIPLDASFAAAGALAGRLAYTGYIDPGPRPAREGPGAPGFGEIVVSAGGGAVGDRLLAAALGAARLLPDRRWRLLAGSRDDAALAALAGRGAADTVVERNRTDFRRLLANCAASVSQAGYNTAVDLLATGAPAVLIPFATEKETEQTLRAERFAARGLAAHLPEAAATPGRLAAAVTERLAAPPVRAAVSLDGIDETARLLAAAP
jgi:predicted glycosyltransferase